MQWRVAHVAAVQETALAAMEADECGEDSLRSSAANAVAAESALPARARDKPLQG